MIGPRRIPIYAAAALLCLGAIIAADSPVFFEDIARTSGIVMLNTAGGKTHKDYIVETTGNGVAIFDYDGDGKEDILIANGTTLAPRPGARPHPQLYHNEGNGRFLEVGEKTGFTAEGWGQG